MERAPPAVVHLPSATPCLQTPLPAAPVDKAEANKTPSSPEPRKANRAGARGGTSDAGHARDGSGGASNLKAKVLAGVSIQTPIPSTTKLEARTDLRAAKTASNKTKPSLHGPAVPLPTDLTDFLFSKQTKPLACSVDLPSLQALIEKTACKRLDRFLATELAGVGLGLARNIIKELDESGENEEVLHKLLSEKKGLNRDLVKAKVKLSKTNRGAREKKEQADNIRNTITTLEGKMEDATADEQEDYEHNLESTRESLTNVEEETRKLQQEIEVIEADVRAKEEKLAKKTEELSSLVEKSPKVGEGPCLSSAGSGRFEADVSPRSLKQDQLILLVRRLQQLKSQVSPMFSFLKGGDSSVVAGRKLLYHEQDLVKLKQVRANSGTFTSPFCFRQTHKICHAAYTHFRSSPGSRMEETRTRKCWRPKLERP